jgi:hypothetical protein
MGDKIRNERAARELAKDNPNPRQKNLHFSGH